MVAIEGRYITNYSGAPYLFSVVITSFVLGVVDPKMPHLRAGVVLIAPAFALAWWTAPRGDNDGLWMLWFPFLLVLIVFVAGCHGIGAKMRR